MKRRENLTLTIPNNGPDRHRLLQTPYAQTGRAIVEQATAAGGLCYAGAGEQAARDLTLLDVKMDFFFEDLEVAAAALRVAGHSMGFPSGTTLKHVGYDPETGNFEFTTLAEW